MLTRTLAIERRPRTSYHPPRAMVTDHILALDGGTLAW
jgi:hypothetical protein